MKEENKLIMKLNWKDVLLWLLVETNALLKTEYMLPMPLIANLGQIDCFIFLEKHENKQSGKSQM